MRGCFAKYGESLVPADDPTEEALQRWGDGELLVLELRKSRNPRYHRYAFRGMQFMYDLSGEEAAFDPWRKKLTIRAGYSTVTGFADGSVLVEAESLAFHNMDDIEFHKVFSDLVQTFINKYGDRVTYDEIMEVARL